MAAAAASGRPSVIEWYRLDESRRLTRVLVLGALLLLTGAISAAVALGAARVPAEMRTVLGFIGGIFTAAGPLSVIIRLQMAMRKDDYLMLRADGLLSHVESARFFLPWDTMDHVSYDEASNVIEVHMRNEDVYRLRDRFCGIGPRELAKRLDMVRRKAIWNLI